MTLTEFLRPRIAEDKAAARAASEVRVREADGSYRGLTPLGEVESTYVRYQQDGITGHHIEGTALWQMFSPARVLAECEAKRRIVDAYERGDEGSGPDYGYGLYVALLALALPYADHPSYLPEWRPEPVNAEH